MIVPIGSSTNAVSFQAKDSFKTSSVPGTGTMNVRGKLVEQNVKNNEVARGQLYAIQRALREQQTTGTRLDYTV